jgi:hypothetical protein
MKLEQLLVQYLYSNRKVSIQEIGTFTVSPDVSIHAENEKESSLPENAIHFEYDSRQQKDEGLIEFIVAQSGKIKSLASSDLESYSLLSRQFLNIGKPMVIEGIGTLYKNQQGIYDFEQGNLVNQKLSAGNTSPVIRENIQDEISFTTPARQTVSRRGIILTVLTLFLLSAAGALYYFLVYSKNKDLQVQPQPVTAAAVNESSASPGDTAQLPIQDSSKPPVSNNAVTAVPPKDSFSFKIVLKEYPSRETAEKAFARLSNYGHRLLISAKDSANFKLSMPFTTPVSDTLRAKDSLRRFFGGRPYVEL